MKRDLEWFHVRLEELSKTYRVARTPKEKQNIRYWYYALNTARRSLR